MKKSTLLTPLLFLSLLATTPCWGQATVGRVAYVNQSGTVKVPLYIPDPQSPLYPPFTTPVPKGTATTYTVELWFGTDVNSLAPAAGSQIRDWAGPGIFKGNANFDIAGTQGGETVWLKLRLWDNGGGRFNSWASALNAGAEVGESTPFSLTLGGIDDTGGVHAPVTLLSGLKSFGILPIPEPTLLWSLPPLALITATAGRRNAKGTFFKPLR